MLTLYATRSISMVAFKPATLVNKDSYTSRSSWHSIKSLEIQQYLAILGNKSLLLQAPIEADLDLSIGRIMKMQFLFHFSQGHSLGQYSTTSSMVKVYH